MLDEADVMIDTQGHKDQTIRIHKTLDKEKCQFLFFSATYDDEVRNHQVAKDYILFLFRL